MSQFSPFILSTPVFSNHDWSQAFILGSNYYLLDLKSVSYLLSSLIHRSWEREAHTSLSASPYLTMTQNSAKQGDQG